jgi:thymidylate synthase
MLDIILAITNKYGIGKNGNLPWYNKEELEIFKEKTEGHIVIMGRKTVENLPRLNNRRIVCWTRNMNLDVSTFKNDVEICNDLDIYIKREEKIFVAGGSELINHVLINYPRYVDKLHISVMKDEYECDTYVNFNLTCWTVIERKIYEKFDHMICKYKISEENEYVSLLSNVFYNGNKKIGRNGETKSLFGKTLNFDLREGFPMITTKKMFIRGIFEELMFFIRGQTDSKILEDKKINIWKGNTNRDFLDKIGKKDREEGIMGPMYGYQWRNFNKPYKGNSEEKGMDQLKNVIELIKKEPNSRRILLTDYNPLQAFEGVLLPCHSIIIQFYVIEGYLDMYCYNRSSDLFHGLPFNIASTALLLSFIAKITNLIPRNFILSLGDCHIYKEHYDSVKIQLKRWLYKFPRLEIKDIDTLEELEEMEYGDIKFHDYKSYPTIKADMVS